MTIAQALELFTLLTIGFLINLPLGYLREGSSRYSLRWFICIHLSVPVIVLLRLSCGFGWHVIPLTVGSAIAGQVVGGRLWRRRKL